MKNVNDFLENRLEDVGYVVGARISELLCHREKNNQGIRIDDETKRDNHTIADVEFMHAPIINEHNKGLDDLVD
ncbi:hypothetical protein RDI58_001081 [Solanum bulbocastanum]|uniref:Uncharacterized protein n=1 Tax=Solanum bulbocastanum TaxID=147425 RepID=A0AAN8YSY5_SOLBU